jgi:hypothetical protein
MLSFGDHVEFLAWIRSVARFQLDWDQVLSEITGIWIDGQTLASGALVQ